MLITIEIPDSVAGQLHLGAKADLRSLLEALVGQFVAEGELAVIHVGEGTGLNGAAPKETSAGGNISTRPHRDLLARLRGIYGDLPLTGENAVLAARRLEKY